MLIVRYKNKKLESICTDHAKAKKVHGEEMANLIHRRIAQLKSASSVEMLVVGKIGRCHALTGNRKHQYAMHLKQPYRLIFVELEDVESTVKIIEIVDYH